MHKTFKLIPILFLLIAIGFVGFSLNKNTLVEYGFNFNRVELIVNQGNITEKLTYAPDQDYHTLFRTFVNPFFENSFDEEKNKLNNTIFLNSLTCSAGTPYIDDFYGNVFAYENKSFLPISLSNVETNEYGCGFGEDYGFKLLNNYEIKAFYTLNPENLFKIENKYYIKFVIFSAKKHPPLFLDKNFLIYSKNIILKQQYLAEEEVILYLPYTGKIPSNINVIEQKYFEFDSNKLDNFLISILFFLIPLLLLVFFFFFGREKISNNIPETLSVYPQERKPWEISSYFNFTNFSRQRNLISSTLLDFYHRKLIDIKTDKKETFFKINESVKKEKLDKFENDFITLLQSIIKYSKTSKSYKGYYSIKKLPSSISGRIVINSNYQDMLKTIEEKKKEYQRENKLPLFLVSAFILVFMGFALDSFFLIPILLFQFFIVLISGLTNPELFFKFKKDYFLEYQKWQAFRKYLSVSYTIKSYDHKGIVIWQKYLVYASALGVASRVLKELEAQKIINSEQFNTYQGISTFSNTIGFISLSSGTSSGSGGFSGAGGGGIGGGGGGGR